MPPESGEFHWQPCMSKLKLLKSRSNAKVTTSNHLFHYRSNITKNGYKPWKGFVTSNSHMKYRSPNTYYSICLLVCFESHKQYFSYMATDTITGDKAANLDLCLALTAFSSEGHTYCNMGLLFLRSYPRDPWFSLLNAVLLVKEQLLPILYILGLTWPARARLKLTTSRMLIESTTTRLLQPVSTIQKL
jgi:hypothetical protein